MALLSKPSWKDHLHYLIAFLCAALNGVVGMLAAQQLRMLVLTCATPS